MINYVEEKKYASFCGSYCRTCDSFTGKKQMVAQRAMALIEKKRTEFEKLFKEEDIRRSILESLTGEASWICPGCKALIDDPREAYICKIRQCCSSRNLDLCSECEEFPCTMLTKHPTIVRLHGVEHLEAN